MNRETLLMQMFGAMLARLGPSGWWPAGSPFEVAAGAVLTQNASWTNAGQALQRMRSADMLSESGVAAAAPDTLEELVRPAGFYRQKAATLRRLVQFLYEEADGDIRNLAGTSMDSLRARLLDIKGIGPETADSILLYALDMPSFVVDAYTRRICVRHSLLPEDVQYAEMREFFMDVLPADVSVYNEYHALLVRVAKEWCRKTHPRCDSCPLRQFLEYEVVC
ncbi:endonuclease III domain-containing protein [Oleidesulfovibrio alaskensis]|uniref:endonuclease III domain-containing protein n=1 Tax=Oleidesulfovibrio alaskensis TaxID=58180 RepID=UPI001A62C1C5|nr:endonuclease III domain-containing protein [Oleidesulfovibrio alaskensis]MBL3581174.1 endonuclease III domain-containing protein [Oleidesulfovibrio alaskensis]